MANVQLLSVNPGQVEFGEAFVNGSILGRQQHLGTGTYVHVIGKGRKERYTPLTKQTVEVLQAWLREPARGDAQVVFPKRGGGRKSSDGIQYLLAQHVETAREACATLRDKRVSPHVLRHYLPFPTMSSDLGGPARLRAEL